MISACSGASGVALRRRHALDNALQNLLDALPGLGADANRVGGIEADHILDLGRGLSGFADGKSILFSTGSTSTPSSSAV